MNVNDVIDKSRNAKSRINYEHKSRIFAEDLRHGGLKKYMIKHFEAFKEESEVDKDDQYEDTQTESPGK